MGCGVRGKEWDMRTYLSRLIVCRSSTSGLENRQLDRIPNLLYIAGGPCDPKQDSDATEIRQA